MNTTDLCAVCRVSMTKREIVRLIPCRHLLHKRCFESLQSHGTTQCPICRQQNQGTESVQRKQYLKYSQVDRSRIVNAAREGRNWKALCESLQINQKTAWRWIANDQVEPKSKKNTTTTAALRETQIEEVIEFIEGDCSVTLEQMKEFILRTFQVNLHVSTIARYLHGRAFSYKGVHYQPESMNSPEKKELRRQYVLKLIEYMQQGKLILNLI